MKSSAFLAGSISRHGVGCPCRICETSPAAPARPCVDTRPRHDFTLPDGSVVTLIFDHGDVVPAYTTCRISRGEVVTASRVMPARKQTAPYIAVRFDRDELLDVAVALRDDSLGASRDHIEAVAIGLLEMEAAHRLEQEQHAETKRRAVLDLEIARTAHEATVAMHEATTIALRRAVAELEACRARLLDATFRRVVPAVTGRDYDELSAELDDTVIVDMPEVGR